MSTTAPAVAHGIKADGDNTNDDLKENEDDNNPLKLLTVGGSQMLLQHVQKITDNCRPLVQQLNTLSNLQITYKSKKIHTY